MSWRSSGPCTRCAPNFSNESANRMRAAAAFLVAADLPGNEAEAIVLRRRAAALSAASYTAP